MEQISRKQHDLSCKYIYITLKESSYVTLHVYAAMPLKFGNTSNSYTGYKTSSVLYSCRKTSKQLAKLPCILIKLLLVTIDIY